VGNQAYDPASRLRRWAVRFQTPPVSVFAAEHGDTNFLNPTAVSPLIRQQQQQPGAAKGGASRPGPVREPGRGLDGAVGEGRRNLVLVGELRGSLYAMPAEHILLDEGVEVRVGRWGGWGRLRGWEVGKRDRRKGDREPSRANALPQ
jgi:serine/threonine-protein kinase/endoribonuclease IRE1